MPYIGKEPTVGNFQKCDAISVVNGQATYALTVGGSAVFPESSNHVLCSLNGILQAPTDSFTISSSNIVFASNLATGDVIDFVMILGNVLDLGVPSDNTVTASKLNDDIISGQTELASEPADTDEFLVSDAGTLKRIDYSLIKGVGQILQVVSTSLVGSEASTTSTSFQDTNLNASITPSSSSNKVLILVTSTGRSTDSGGTSCYTIARGSTNLGSSDGMNRINQPADNELITPVAMHFLDSPNTTSATTYRPQLKSTNTNNTAKFGEGNTNQVITLFEVKG